MWTMWKKFEIICKSRGVLKPEVHSSYLFHLLAQIPALACVDLPTLPSGHIS